MRPTQLDKGLIIDFWSCIFGSFFLNLTGGEGEKKFKLAFCLFVESLSIIPKASAHTYLRYLQRECTILFIVYLFAISFTIKIKASKPERIEYIRPYEVHTH